MADVPGTTEKSIRFAVHSDHGRTRAAVFAVMILALAALPAFAGRAVLQDLFFVFTMLALAQYWNLLAGYAGLVSIGQQAFIGLGAYTLFAATLIGGLDPMIAMLLGGLIAMILALPTALVVFRLRGAYFAIGTWVAAEVFRLMLAQVKTLGGGTGTSLGPDITNQMAGSEMDRRDLRRAGSQPPAISPTTGLPSRYWSARLPSCSSCSARAAA